MTFKSIESILFHKLGNGYMNVVFFLIVYMNSICFFSYFRIKKLFYANRATKEVMKIRIMSELTPYKSEKQYKCENYQLLNQSLANKHFKRLLYL